MLCGCKLAVAFSNHIMCKGGFPMEQTCTGSEPCLTTECVPIKSDCKVGCTVASESLHIEDSKDDLYKGVY